MPFTQNTVRSALRRIPFVGVMRRQKARNDHVIFRRSQIGAVPCGAAAAVLCPGGKLYGTVLSFCNTFQRDTIRIVTENRAFAARLPKLFHKAFGLAFDRMPEGGEEGAKLTFEISERDKLAGIVNVCGFSMEQNLSLHINFGLLEEDCCRVSFLRGVFLAGGSVTDPAKRYHMEFVTSHYKVSRELEALLIDMGFRLP